MSRRARMSIFALTSVLVFGVAAGWLTLTYLGVISREVRVQASLTSLGDSLGPGSKVRYHGLIVGTVHGVTQESGRFSAELLINPKDADDIPRSVVARVLPATLFGSEYVELVGGQTEALAAGRHLSSGDVVLADDTNATVRLMDSFDDAERMLGAVDTEQINTSMGALATALDGHGDDIATFLTDADDYVTTMTANRDLLFDNLRLFGTTSRTLADIEPDVTSTAEHSRTTAKTITEQREQISTLIGSTTKLADRGTTLMDVEGVRILKLMRSTGPALDIVAAHDSDVTKLLDRLPTVVTNGSNGIKGGAVQMQGMMGLNPYEPYTAADCARYGSMVGSNCGNPTGDSTRSAAPDGGLGSAADLTDLAGVVQGLLDGSSSARSADDDKPTPDDDTGLGSPGTLPFLGQLLGAGGGLASILTLLAGSAGTR